MYTRITLNDFRETFRVLERNNNFSYEGMKVLYDYLEDYEDSTDEMVEFDCIALCCEYTESTIKEALEAYGLKTLEELEDNTTVLKVSELSDDVIIYQQF